MQGLGDEPGREGQEYHHEQQEQVEPQEEPIRSREPVGESRVGKPRRTDRQKADDVGHE